MRVLQRVHTEWQWPLSGVHSIMMVKSAPCRGRGCTPSPFHSIYHHEKSCDVRFSWEGGYTPPYFSSTPIRTLWCPPSTGGRTKSEDQSAEIPPKYQYLQRVYRVLEFLSSRPNWVPSPPHPQWVLLLLPSGLCGETHSLARKGVRGPNYA